MSEGDGRMYRKSEVDVRGGQTDRVLWMIVVHAVGLVTVELHLKAFFFFRSVQVIGSLQLLKYSLHHPPTNL